MAATLTNNTAIAKYIHAGAVTAVAEYTLTATLSVDSVVRLVKIPHGATLVDAYMSMVVGTAAATEATIEDEDANQFTATVSMVQNTMFRATTGLPKSYSLSDAAVNRFKWLSVAVGSNASDSPTVGDKVRLVATYVMDNPDKAS